MTSSNLNQNQEKIANINQYQEIRCQRGHDEPASDYVDGIFICDSCKIEWELSHCREDDGLSNNDKYGVDINGRDYE